MLASIPSPSSNGFYVGPLFFHFYGLCYVVGITAAVLLTRRLWREKGGDPDLVYTVAIWGVPAGILGARLYHDVTSWGEVPHNWWGWLAIWQGGLGIWGGIAGGFIGGAIPLRRQRVSIARFMDAAAPGLLVAQAIGRVGNYFNQELFGGPTSLPWGLQISPEHRPAGYLAYSTFHPTFLYELIWDLALAATLLWLIHHKQIRAPGIFALYVTGYSAFRIFEERLRVDPAHHILGERLNFWVASLLTIAGFVWFLYTQRAGGAPGQPRPRGTSDELVVHDGRAPVRPIDLYVRTMRTVYEAAGGEEGLLRLAQAWHARVMADEVVSHAFSHGFDPDHTERLASYWAEALGGPETFSAAYGDESAVVRMHSGMGPHEEMDRRAIACFDQALSDVGLDREDRLARVLHDYFAWTTTTTMARYPDSADDVPGGLSIPRWSWDGLIRAN